MLTVEVAGDLCQLKFLFPAPFFSSNPEYHYEKSQILHPTKPIGDPLKIYSHGTLCVLKVSMPI